MIIRIFTYAAVLFTIVAMYLKMNKVWKRKHDPEVASSLSIVALAMSAGLNSIWAMNFIIHWDAGAAVDNLLLVTESIFFIVVGAGVFVKEKKKLSFWSKIKRSLSVERKEAGNLLGAMTGRDQAAKTVDFLHQLAMIDGVVDDADKKLIGAFADHRGVAYSPESLDQGRPVAKEENFERLRTGMEEHLKEGPSAVHVTQLADVLQRLVKADDLIKAPKSLGSIAWDIWMLAITLGSLGMVGYVSYNDLSWPDPTFRTFALIDLGIIAICLTEFVVRFVKAPSKSTFLRQNWYDLPGLVPMYAESFAWLRAARTLRVIRVARLLRLIYAVRRVSKSAVFGRRSLTDEEALILEELRNMMKEYTDKESAGSSYKVLVIPQEHTHATMVKVLKPNLRRIAYEGGYGFVVGSYTSQKYAEMISTYYRGKQLMTVVHFKENEDESDEKKDAPAEAAA